MSAQRRADFRSVVLPFIIFTAIWGSTWIVIRDQLGTVPPQWSVTYRFVIAAAAMAVVAKWKGESLRSRARLIAAAVLGFTQFCVNFNAVYLAERHITSGVVATVFALLLIPTACSPGHSSAIARATASCGVRWSRSPASPCCSSMSCASIRHGPMRSWSALASRSAA